MVRLGDDPTTPTEYVDFDPLQEQRQVRHVIRAFNVPGANPFIFNYGLQSEQIIMTALVNDTQYSTLQSIFRNTAAKYWYLDSEKVYLYSMRVIRRFPGHQEVVLTFVKVLE